MRWAVSLPCLALALSCASIGCNSEGSGNGGSGGTAGGGGSGGGTGGMGGTAGIGGSDILTCNNPHDCDDVEPCTTDSCGDDRVCVHESLADDTVCLSEIGLSICLSGVCQLIWPSCTEPGAEDGDFCEPLESPDPPRLGRCSSGTCAVEPCEIEFDCWDGDLCTSDICEGGECSHPNAPNGTSCGIVVPMVCVEGDCVTPPG